MAALKLTVLFSLATVSLCNDLRSGFTDSRQRLVFEQTYDYRPSIYQRSEIINVDSHGDEVISRVEVIDKRELKDGIAEIISGGVGQKSVAISIKSPAVFRGMTFEVRIWVINPADSKGFNNAFTGLRGEVQRVGDYFRAGVADTYRTVENEEFNTGVNAGNQNLRAGASRHGVTANYGNGADVKSGYNTNGYYGYDDQQYETKGGYGSYVKQ